MPIKRYINRPAEIALAAILVAEIMLLADVQGWWQGFLPRLVRANMTPLCWLLYLVFALGLLTKLDGTSWFRRFPNRFWVCWLWSVTAWCFFDTMNFYFMVDGPNAFHRWCSETLHWKNFYFMRDPHSGYRAWEYRELPDLFEDRLLGYLVAFGAIAPGMFLSAEVLMRAGMGRVKGKAFGLARWALWVVLLGGLPLALVPVIVGGPISNLALWVGTFCVLDPINAMLGRPSILVDWSRGRWGRTLALGAGGLWCGFLWEFWNYWATTKWVYHLPFLGSWEKIKYFEMPVPGLAGFVAFGIQTWVMWQTSLLVLGRFVEGEGDRESDREVAEEMCF